jgi:hypothetical protein
MKKDTSMKQNVLYAGLDVDSPPANPKFRGSLVAQSRQERMYSLSYATWENWNDDTMLFRRLSENLKTQNWPAVAIDFIIVVLGVFIAIQVSNWNDVRLSKIQGAALTERLRTDLRFEGRQYQILIDYYVGVHKSAMYAATVLSGEADLSDEKFLIAAYRASQYSTFPHARTTYDELKSTGTIALVEDWHLRILATGLFDNVNEATITDLRHSDYRDAFQENVPNDVQRALNRACGDRNEFDADGVLIARDISYECTLDLPGEAISDATSALLTQTDLIGLLRRRIATIESSLTIFELTSELITKTDT